MADAAFPGLPRFSPGVSAVKVTPVSAPAAGAGGVRVVW